MTEPTRPDGQWPPQGAFGPPPPGPHDPWQVPHGYPPPPVGGAGGQRGRFLLLGGIGVLVLALGAGLLAWNVIGSGSDEPAAKRDLRPFQQAVAELATAPGLRYKDSSAAGLTRRDVTVTAAGSRYGTTGLGGSGLDREILHVGGKTFTRRQAEPDDKAANTWNAGDEGGGTGPAQELVERRPSPAVLAMLLSQVLDEAADVPAARGESAGRRPTVNGTPALAVDTSAGRLLVTEKKPHRVLRLEPYGVSRRTGSSTGSTEQTSWNVRPAAAPDLREQPSDTPDVTEGPLRGSDSEGMDLTPVTGDATEPMFSTLEKQTKELENATDSGISLSLSGSGNVRCGSGGCTASNSFAGQITTSAKGRLTGGNVTAVMTASFTIDGRGAGQCTSAQGSFAVTGAGVSGSLSCSNPGAGPTFASIEAQKKAAARAQSRASGGRPVQYRIPYSANTLITARALATVEVKKLVDRVKRERGNSGCTKSHNLPSAYRVSLVRSDDDPRFFPNLIPEDKPDWFKPVSPDMARGRSGNYLYVVLENGELIIGKRTAGHINLAQGKRVLAAGEFKTKGGDVVYLDNKSGHYRPYGVHARKAAEDAFKRNGFTADGKYNAAWGKPGC